MNEEFVNKANDVASDEQLIEELNKLEKAQQKPIMVDEKMDEKPVEKPAEE